MHEQWQESDEEDQEDRNNAVLDPIEHWDEVVATRLSAKNIALCVDLADGQLLVECPEVQDYTRASYSNVATRKECHHLRVIMNV